MNTLRRRKFLAGLGLGAASPLLPSIAGKLVSEALAQEGSAAGKFKRLFVFVGSNGLLERFTTCAARGEKDFDLGPIYQPVAAFKDRMTIAHRFFIPHSKDLHGSQTSTLTVMPCIDPKASHFRAPAGGISIDRFIGKKIGTGDSFSSTAVGRGISVSADGPGQPFPLNLSPSKAFATYFGGGVAPGTGGVGGSFVSDFVAKDKSILDILRADAGRLNARLAAPERAKLDQYLDSLRALERQINTRGTVQNSCQKPPAPAAGPTPPLNQAIEQLVDITFHKHQCGLTHVTYISFEGMEGPHIKYDWLQDPRNHHDDNHANDAPILQRIETWWFEMVARLANQLVKAPEGNGTMLDNSLIMMVNTGGGVHHRGFDKHPLVLLGGRAGSAGRYLQYPEGKHCMSEAYVSIANMMGAPTEKFGDPMFCPGPLPGLG
jgi:Protein of unknown function (DUF1552)